MRQKNAVFGNDLRTSNAIHGAEQCVRNIVHGESLRMKNDLFARDQRGEAPPFGPTAQALLKERHDALAARLKRYQLRLQGDESQARDTINAAADAAR